MLARRLRAAAGNHAVGYFIDQFGAPDAAYSTRLLSSTYAGSCLRVRRSSDNAEQDIGFSGGALDESALTTFVGANDGFVVTWYDQSGNANHVTNSTASQQSRIVNSGTVDKELGFPSLFSASSTTGYDTGFASTTTKTIIAVANLASGGAGAAGRIVSSYDGGALDAATLFDYVYSSSTLRYFDGNASVSIASTTADWSLVYAYRTAGGTIGLSVDGGSETTATGASGSNVDTLFLIEEGGASTTEVLQSMTEFIIYLSDQSSNKTEMKSNINNYYGIY